MKRELREMLKTLRDKERGTIDPELRRGRKMRNDMTELLMFALINSGEAREEFPVFMNRIAWSFANAFLSTTSTILRNSGIDDPAQTEQVVMTLCAEIERHARDSLTNPEMRWIEVNKP